MNIDSKIYPELKTANAISIVRINEDTAAFNVFQYNPFTGVRLTNTVDQFSLPKLRNQIAEKQAEIDGLKAILADAEAMPVPEPVVIVQPGPAPI